MNKGKASRRISLDFVPLYQLQQQTRIHRRVSSLHQDSATICVCLQHLTFTLGQPGILKPLALTIIGNWGFGALWTPTDVM